MAQGHFIQHFRQKGIVEFSEILFQRSYEYSGHIRTTGTHGQMVRTVREIMMRPVASSENHNGTVLAILEIREKVEPRLRIPLRYRSTVYKPVKQFGRRLGRTGPQHEYASDKFPVMEQVGILDRCKIGKRAASVRGTAGSGSGPEMPFPDSIQQGIHIILQRHPAAPRTLEMMVVRSGSPAFRSVIEEYVFRICPCKVENIHIASPYRLSGMAAECYHEMIRENRIRIDKDIVFLAFPAIETDMYLLRRPVFRTQETGSRIEGSGIRPCCRRYDTRRIELYADIQTADGKPFHLHPFQSPEIFTGKGPARQLVIDKFLYSLHDRRFFRSFSSRHCPMPAPLPY